MEHPQVFCGKEISFTKTNVIPPAIIIPKRKAISGTMNQTPPAIIIQNRKTISGTMNQTNEPNHYNRVPISYTLSTFILDLIPQRTIDPLWVYFDDRNPRPYFSDHHQIVPDVILHPQIEKGNLGK